MTDDILELARHHRQPDVEQVVRAGLKYAGVLSHTPHERLVLAISEEVADVMRRARDGIEALGSNGETPERREALDLLAEGKPFPRTAFAELVERIRANGGDGRLADEIDLWRGKYDALERRVTWLLHGTPRERRASLDPFVDSDEILHWVMSAFRFESRVLEMLAVNRIAQSPSIGTFFRSTKEAETKAVRRFFDTYALYSNTWEWGLDSVRGRLAVKRMNEIHGRYYIPNDGMKFVLLQGAFTWLDGADRLAHRPVTQMERQAMLCTFVRMGEAMNIEEINEDYEEMYGWYRDVCESCREYTPLKRETFEAVVGNSVEGQPRSLKAGLVLAARVAMDDTYLEAVGYERPSPQETQAVKAVVFSVGSYIEQLPYAPYLRSLQNSPARRSWTDPMDLGSIQRSRYMPVAWKDRPNDGFPEWQLPVQRPEEADPMDLPEITWEEVGKHTTEESLWLVVDGIVYDVTTMLDVHPGGRKILERWAGKDATTAFAHAKHSPGTVVFTHNFRIGRVVGAPVPA